MHALVVLALGIDNLDGLCLIADDTAIAYLTTHLAIERRIIEHELIELVLLLSHLAIAQDMTLVFGIVIAHELLLACGELCPVAVFHSCGIAGALLLLLHLLCKLYIVNCKPILTADQFSKVEGESIGIEEAESLYTVEFGLAVSLQLCHRVVEHADTLIQCTEERVFLFLHHL